MKLHSLIKILCVFVLWTSVPSLAADKDECEEQLKPSPLTELVAKIMNTDRHEEQKHIIVGWTQQFNLESFVALQESVLNRFNVKMELEDVRGTSPDVKVVMSIEGRGRDLIKTLMSFYELERSMRWLAPDSKSKRRTKK